MICEIHVSRPTPLHPLSLSFCLLAREDEGTGHLHRILASSNDNFCNLNLASGQDGRLFVGRLLIGCHWLCDHGAKLKIDEAWRCVLYSLLLVVSYYNAIYRRGRHTYGIP